MNFTTLPDNGGPYTYKQRAIPYLENPEARHVGNFDNESYFDAIDAIKSDNLVELNRVVVANGKEIVTEAEFYRLKADFNDFQANLTAVIKNEDTTYGLKGIAAPWRSSSTGEKLMIGGAEQIVTPLNGINLIRIGIIPKY